MEGMVEAEAAVTTAGAPEEALLVVEALMVEEAFNGEGVFKAEEAVEVSAVGYRFIRG